MKLKVGDKVKIREDLEQKEYKYFYVTNDMLQFRGRIGVITELDEIYSSFKLDIDGKWWWHKKMVEPLTFPRMMEVSDCEDFNPSFVKEVFHCEPLLKYPYLTFVSQSEIPKNFIGFKYAREITTAPEKAENELLKAKVLAFVDEIINLVK